MQDAAPTTVDRDHLCIACGYNLRGLPVDSQCPECALAVAESLKGDFLAFASPQYRARIILGMKLIDWGMLSLVLLGISSVFLGTLTTIGTFSLAQVVLTVVVRWVPLGMMIVGGWLLATPDAGYNGQTDPKLARAFTRAGVVVLAAAEVVPALIFWVLPPATAGGIMPVFMGMNIAKLAVYVAMFFCTVLCIRWIASRVPSPKWVKIATRRLWVLPALAVIPLVGAIALSMGGGMAPAGGFGFAVVIGLTTLVCWIVALIMYWNMVFSVRRLVARVHATAANTGRV